MSMNTRLLLITFLCVFSIGQCIAQTWYTGKDNFRQAIFQDSILSDYNYQAEKDIVNVTETDIHPGEGFRPSLSLDIANRNNRENKKYPVYRQNQTGTITKAGYVEKLYGEWYGDMATLQISTHCFSEPATRIHTATIFPNYNTASSLLPREIQSSMRSGIHCLPHISIPKQITTAYTLFPLTEDTKYSSEKSGNAA